MGYDRLVMQTGDGSRYAALEMNFCKRAMCTSIIEFVKHCLIDSLEDTQCMIFCLKSTYLGCDAA